MNNNLEVNNMPIRKSGVKVSTKGKANPPHYYCAQEEAIARINEILVGNGHPEDGIAYKVLAMHDNIENIKNGVATLQRRSEENAKAAASAVSALDMYKKEIASIDIGRNITEKLVEKKWKIWFEVLGLLFVAVATVTSIIIGLSNNSQNARMEEQQKEIKTEIKNITPDSIKINEP